MQRAKAGALRLNVAEEAQYDFGNPSWHRMRLLLLAALVSIVFRTPGLRAADAPASSAPTQDVNLLELSLEELGAVRVTSVSRRSEALSGAAAAIHVVSNDEIRRFGITTLPEALEYVPGIEVARANSRQWAITARGFNGVFANKLLVLMDGRTLYTPLFSGVFWEETDAVLEDIDRIEVIRGPGATLWGANAVNGVINIMTKNTRDTQGLLITGGGGVEERGFGSIRYGGRLATNAHYRVYAKHHDRDEFTLNDGRGAADGSWKSQSGFRIDWAPSEHNAASLQADYYYGEFDGTVFARSRTGPGVMPTQFRDSVEGANVIGRWKHDLSAESDLTVQAYYDHTDRGFGIGNEVRDTFDLDAQHRVAAGERHEVVWGAGYRYSVDDITESQDFSASEPRVGLQLFSAFVQDELALVPDRLHLTLGTKLEHNDFTGWELQPSARLAWTPHDHHTLWSAVSRAVRTPSRADRGLGLFVNPPPSLANFPFPVLIEGMGSPGFGSEELLAYEVGYRVRPHRRLTLDWAGFYNEYEDLWAAIALEGRFLRDPPQLVIPAAPRNLIVGESYGTELAATWQPLDNWRLRAGYSLLKVNLHTEGLVRSVTEDNETSSPQQTAFLWSDLDLGPRWELGVGLKFVDSRPSLRIADYTGLEARLAWKPAPNCELAIIGRDLLDPHHREAAPLVVSVPNVEVDRAIYAKLTLRY